MHARPHQLERLITDTLHSPSIVLSVFLAASVLVTRHPAVGLCTHLASEAAKVGGDGGEGAKAEEGVQVQDCHAAAAGELVELHAEPGNVHDRLDQRGNESAQVIAQPLHVSRQPLVHVLRATP